MELTTRNLVRLRELDKTLAVSQHDLEQAISDQQTAEAVCGRRATPYVFSASPTPRSIASSPIAWRTRHSSCQAQLTAGNRSHRGAGTVRAAG